MDDAAIAFDNLQMVESLRDAGVEKWQAQAVAATIRNAVIKSAATNADLRSFGGELKTEIASTKSWPMTTQLRSAAAALP